jgi:hypothetical protein
MKKLAYLFITFLIISCSNNKVTYWCGDHPCINKKEKENYFKKTMIVEIRKFDKKELKKNSDIEKIMQQAQTNEKNRIKDEKELAKQAKLEEKNRIKEEKELAKQAKLEEKNRIKEEKELAKQAKLEEKNRIKEEKELAKQIKIDEKKIIKIKKKSSKQSDSIMTAVENDEIDSSSFRKLVEKITKRNSLKPYPEINDIPN